MQQSIKRSSIDSQRYRVHPDCKKLLCFVYDPEGWISNPCGLENDLNKREDDFEKGSYRTQGALCMAILSSGLSKAALLSFAGLKR
ncbi:MAG: hypothetical protein NDI81_12805 [Desulfobacula sp.]|nr:hypothetical protein [Desulfobacula sp.]